MLCNIGLMGVALPSWDAYIYSIQYGQIDDDDLL